MASLFGDLFAATHAPAAPLFCDGNAFRAPTADKQGVQPAAGSRGKRKKIKEAASPVAGQAAAGTSAARAAKRQEQQLAPPPAAGVHQRQQRAGQAAEELPPGSSRQAVRKWEREDPEPAQGSAAKSGGRSGPASDGAGDSDGQAQGRGEAAGTAAQEEERLQRTIFVGNLAATVRRKALQKLFSRYGSVESVRVRSLPVRADAKMPRKAAALSGAIDTARASAHAYVVFAEPAAAEAALAHNMQEFEGLHLRVDRAARSSRGGRGDAGVQYDPARTLFVGNLHRELEDEELLRAFMDPSLPGNLDGGVEGVRIVRDPRTSLGKGIGFVLFTTRAACKAGLLQDGKAVRGRALRVTRLKRDPQHAAGKGTAKWQGVVTKGRASKTAAGAAGGGRMQGKVPPAGKAATGKRKAAGKRPAVAARKQQKHCLPEVMLRRPDEKANGR